MDCETCTISNFVYSDLYCQGCPDRPKPKTKKGRAYLFRKDSANPVFSIEIESPEGIEYEVAAVELMRNFRIEFVEEG